LRTDNDPERSRPNAGLANLLFVPVVLWAVVASLGWWISWYPRATVWGDVATGTAAIGTLVAVAASVRFAQQDRRDRIAAQGQLDAVRQDQLDEARRSQALQVTWWTTPCRHATNPVQSWLPNSPAGLPVPLATADHEPYLGPEGEFYGTPRRESPGVSLVAVDLHIMNASDTPVRAGAVVANGDLRFVGLIMPGEHVYFEVVWDHSDGGSASGRVIERILDGADIDWIQFVDTRGIHWRRKRDWSLVTAPDAPAKMPSY
jgi:hypothetical protein